jgi:hypothetical protein
MRMQQFQHCQNACGWVIHNRKFNPKLGRRLPYFTVTLLVERMF